MARHTKLVPIYLGLVCLLILQTVSTESTIVYPSQSWVAFGQGCTPIPSGLVSWWTGNSNTYDDSGENHGKVQGEAIFGNGMVGQAFVLDGRNDYVIVPDSSSLDITNAITIDAWIKPTKGGVTILDKTGSGDSANYRFFLGLADQESDMRLGFWNGSTYVLSTSSIANNQFSHVAMTLVHADGVDTLKLYINGVLDATHTIGFGAVNNGPLRIGSDILGRFFQGTIDEVELFNRELSPSEIQRIHSAGSLGKCVPASGFFGPA